MTSKKIQAPSFLIRERLVLDSRMAACDSAGGINMNGKLSRCHRRRELRGRDPNFGLVSQGEHKREACLER